MASTAISAQGSVLTIGTGVGGATPTPIKNIHDFSGFDGSASELDRTNLDSTAKEFVLGLVDPGSFSINFDLDLADAGQAALRSHQQSGAIANFTLSLPGATNNTYTFTGFVKKFSVSGGVDAIVKSSADIRISGPVVVSTVAP